MWGGGVAEPAALPHTHTHLPKAQGSTKWVGRVALITRKENHNQGECMGVAIPQDVRGENIHGRGTLAKKVGQIIPRGSVADERKPQV